MVRYVLRWEVPYGHYADVVRAVEACNAIRRDRGWPEWTPWAPFMGKSNEIVLVSDYPDIAAYASDQDAAYADPDFMNAWRQCVEHTVQGSRWDEVLQPAPSLA
jgi:hypothetical protein